MEGSPRKELRSQGRGQDVSGLGPFTTPRWGPGLTQCPLVNVNPEFLLLGSQQGEQGGVGGLPGSFICVCM